MKIIHIGSATVFLPPFIKLIKTKPFNMNEHCFYLWDSISSSDLVEDEKVKIIRGNKLKKIALISKLFLCMEKSDKIILHGLFNPLIILLLFFNRKILKKSYWVLWGADLYGYKFRFGWKNRLRYFFLGSVIKSMGNIITYIRGDYDCAVEWFGTKANYYECLMYESNLYKEFEVSICKNSTKNILVGNSADPANNHLDIFDYLEPYKDQDIKIYAPLSYGNNEYSEKVIKEGIERFGEKFEALTELVSSEEYIQFLSKIDFAIFNHKHQQGMGNTISLLSLGKKVYMRSDVTQWKFFKEHRIEVFDIEKFSLEVLEPEIKTHNQNNIKDYFSKENYQNQLLEIFQ